MNATNRDGRQGAIGVLRDAVGRYLVIERSQVVRAPGRFCFPGGALEVGESEEDAVVRELHEELHLKVRPLKRLWRSRSPSGVLLHWWSIEMEAVVEPVANPREVARWFWMHAAELSRHPKTLATNREFLASVRSGKIDITRS